MPRQSTSPNEPKLNGLVPGQEIAIWWAELEKKRAFSGILESLNNNGFVFIKSTKGEPVVIGVPISRVLYVSEFRASLSAAKKKARALRKTSRSAKP